MARFEAFECSSKCGYHRAIVARRGVQFDFARKARQGPGIHRVDALRRARPGFWREQPSVPAPLWSTASGGVDKRTIRGINGSYPVGWAAFVFAYTETVPGPRACVVSFTDAEGMTRSVKVAAESVFQAAALDCRRIPALRFH